MNETLGFEFDTVADLAGAQAKSHAADEGYKTAEQVLKLNNQARTANAETLKKLQKQTFELIPQIQKNNLEYEKKKGIQLRNESRLIRQELLAAGHEPSLQKVKEWENENNKFIKESGYYSNLGAKLRSEGKPLLASKVENLTGQRGVAFKQILALEAANNLENSFEQAKHNLVLKGYGPENQDLTWATATDAADFEALWSHYLVTEGLNTNNLGELGDEFLNQNYWPAANKTKYKVIQKATNAFIAADTAERHKTQASKLIEASKFGGQRLLEAISEFTTSNPGGDYGGAPHEWAQKKLLEALELQQITPEQFKAALNPDNKILHRGTGTKKSLSELSPIWDLDKNTEFAAKLRRAENAFYAAKEVENQNNDRAFVSHVNNFERQEGRPINESEALSLIAEWSQRPENFGRPVPTIITNLTKHTLEDRADLEIKAMIQARVDRALPVGDLWRGIKGDTELRARMKELSESALGQGLDEAYYSQANSLIDYLTRDALEMSMGTTDVKSVEYWTMYNNAKVKYATFYREAAFGSPQEKHNFAMEKVTALFSNPASLMKQQSISPRQSYTKKVNTALGKLKLGFEGGDQDVRKILESSNVLEEQDYKQIELYAKNPLSVSLPPICRDLANSLRFIKGADMRHVTQWDIANMQYKFRTGNDLPKPRVLDTLATQDSLVQHFLTYKPSHARVVQASIYAKGNKNYNIPGALAEGIVPTTPPELVPTDSGGNIL